MANKYVILANAGLILANAGLITAITCSEPFECSACVFNYKETRYLFD